MGWNLYYVSMTATYPRGQNQLFTYYARNMSSLSYDFFVNSEQDKIDIYMYLSTTSLVYLQSKSSKIMKTEKPYYTE